MMRLAEELTEFVWEHDVVQDKSVPKEVVIRIFQILLNKNRIIYQRNPQGDLVGFIESWRINYQQLGWKLCHSAQHPNLDMWDIETGNICYLANIVIAEDQRMGSLMRFLKTEFLRQNYMCDYFIGEAVRKKHRPVKVYSRQDFYEKYSVEEEVTSGK